MKESLRHIFSLGCKEIVGLFRDPLLVVLIIYAFSVNVYMGAKSVPDAISNAAIAIVDEDGSALSKRIGDAFIPPLFLKPEKISRADIDRVMDQGRYTFVVVFPPSFQEKVLANDNPEVQVNVDATRMSQAFTGNGYIQQIINRYMVKSSQPVHDFFWIVVNVSHLKIYVMFPGYSDPLCHLFLYQPHVMTAPAQSVGNIFDLLVAVILLIE